MCGCVCVRMHVYVWSETSRKPKAGWRAAQVLGTIRLDCQVMPGTHRGLVTMLLSSPEVLQMCTHMWVGTQVPLEKKLQVSQATGTPWSHGPGPGGARSHPTSMNAPPQHPLARTRQEILIFTRHTACLLESQEPPSIFFLNDNFPPFFCS